MKREKQFGIRQQVENPVLVEKFLKELCQKPPRSIEDLEKRKRAFSAREKLPTILNRDLIAVMDSRDNPRIVPTQLKTLLQKRAVRTISGVSPIGILTKPYPCPGKCVYCPTEDRMPKSYLSSQPAAARAVRNNFHPFKQVSNRIIALEDSGHPVSKLEVIVMGGTWSFLPHNYQSWYIKKIFDAANEQFSENKEQRTSRKLEIENGKSHSLYKAQKINETAHRRVIGLTLETRPDFITERELVRMRRYGCTRIEIGVQTLDDEVQRLTKRGHLSSHVTRAMKLMKDFGFKVCFHLMPGLPGSTPEKDLKWMREVFENPDFRPDFVKIYPCVVLETAELKSWWQEGRYQPLRDKELVKLLLQFKMFVPPWTRIMRLMRDIPVENILDGAKFSNLRQILKNQPKKLREIVGEDFLMGSPKSPAKAENDFVGRGEMSEINGIRQNERHNKAHFDDWPCKCIRCREIGFMDMENAGENPHSRLTEPVLKRRDYEASDGLETFLSFETADEKTLFALLRLRKPSGQKFSQFGLVLHNAALVREVHSYGTEITVGDAAGVGQHRGLGRKLLVEAERIARDEWGLKRMTIIAGIGTREYYRKFGYELKSTYMTKKL
ncbi:tRNA uridine(34) 5-carboxymethylaminomethyl modification radical SAM/GNAT enzyme Elp3 [Candidatus Gracilibacteria bacterium]|nr:tRNA uridine(34) 5-carboxymethylaminomethyl modification radical SAM/GNAT enzyme Elp3 [Candidatus Gracilibacteria bacterium]